MFDPRSISGRRVLVIAPHPDDESLGCGGLIASLIDAGWVSYTVFTTDGGASHSHSLDWPRQRLVAARQCEAEEALSRLGATLHPRDFLGMRDAEPPGFHSQHWLEVAAFMRQIVESFLPDLVLLPWRRDPHCDHRAAWRLISGAIVSSDFDPATLEYAIWLDELGNPDDFPRPDEAEPIAFDIRRVLKRKLMAIAAHRTQTTKLINDDPQGFFLSAATIARLAGPYERYWRARA